MESEDKDKPSLQGPDAPSDLSLAEDGVGQTPQDPAPAQASEATAEPSTTTGDPLLADSNVTVDLGTKAETKEETTIAEPLKITPETAEKPDEPASAAVPSQDLTVAASELEELRQIAEIVAPSDTAEATNAAAAAAALEMATTVATDVEEKEAFLPPPPASTLLIRKARSSSTGAPTYVVSSTGPISSVKPVDGQDDDGVASVAKPPSVVKRRPGRPVGSVGPYKKKKYGIPLVPDASVGEGGVRVSSRMSTSIFKHDTTGKANLMAASYDDSPYVYTTAIKAGQGGKPSMSTLRKPYSKGKGLKKDKDPYENCDPVTGKRKYKRRKKSGTDDRRDTYDEFSEESENEGDKAAQFHLSDNGIWRPTDDLRLLINMAAKGDLQSIFYGVKFSCYFTLKEIEERWRKLLYHDKSSLVSQNAINALHPDVKARIYYDCLFSSEEEALIATIPVPPDSNPSVKVFQKLLDENPHVFNKYRTPRRLMMHWLDMKDFHLLCNQNELDYNPSHEVETLEELANDYYNDSDDDIENEAVMMELKTEERNLRKKLRLLEDESCSWKAITEQIIEDGMKNNTLPPFPTDFDNKTFALLRGKEVHYGMTSREIILGRSTKDCKVDADLTEEGSCMKISRKQAIIRLKRLGRFVIINRGKRPILVDRKVVHYRCAAQLHDQSVIQIAQITLVFLINEALIAKVIERDVSGEIYASFRDLENEPSSTTGTKSLGTSSTARKQLAYPSTSTSSGILGRTSQFIKSEAVEGPPSEQDPTLSPICQPPASYITIS